MQESYNVEAPRDNWGNIAHGEWQVVKGVIRDEKCIITGSKYKVLHVTEPASFTEKYPSGVS